MKNFIILTLVGTFFATLSTGISSCDRDDYPTPKDTIYADPEFLDWWWCKEGSWWVYKRIDDTIAHQFDTVRVIKIIREITFEPDFSEYATDELIMHLKHSSEFFNPLNEDAKQILTYATQSNGLRSLSHEYAHHHFEYKWFLRWPIEYNFNRPDVNGITLLDSNRLLNPLLNKPTIHYLAGYNAGELWISKNIGIVKYKFGYDGSVWELVDYHVIQN